MAGTLSAREAAIAARVSERTIRNWISSGKLHAERTPAGFRVREEDLSGKFSPNGENRPASSGRLGNDPEISAGLSELVALVRDLLPKAEAAAMWQARAEFLAGQLEQAQVALEAPKQPDPAEIAPQRLSDNAPIDTSQRPPEPRNGRHRAWWRWW